MLITQSVSGDEWKCKHPDDWGVATMNLRGNAITLENLTIENSNGFDRKTSRVVPREADTFTHQKTIPFTGLQMALRPMGDTRIRAIKVHFKSFAGDTVSLWDTTGRMFDFKDCTMEGGVKFYCPRGWVYAEDGKFYANTGPASIWHDGSANQDSKTGLKNCSFDGFENFNPGRYHKDAQFYLVNCHFPNLVPASNIIKWDWSVYYYNCHRPGGDYPWFKNNLSTAKGSPFRC